MNYDISELGLSEKAEICLYDEKLGHLALENTEMDLDDWRKDKLYENTERP